MAGTDDPDDPPLDKGIHWRRTVWFLQPYFQKAASDLGHFRTCHLSKCRRARRCEGCHPLAELATTHYRQFPPCVHAPQSQSALNQRFALNVAQGEAATRRNDLSPEETEQETDAEEARFQAWIADDSLWPPVLGGTARMTAVPAAKTSRVRSARPAEDATAAMAPTRQPARPALAARGRGRSSRRGRSASRETGP